MQPCAFRRELFPRNSSTLDVVAHCCACAPHLPLPDSQSLHVLLTVPLHTQGIWRSRRELSSLLLSLESN